MWTSKTKCPGQVERVRSSATVLETIIITGAASGIGRATALIFAREGANVVCADINEKGADETAAEVSRKGSRALAIKVDVTKRAEVDDMAERAFAAFGRVQLRCAFLIQGAVRPGDAQFEGRISMSRCVRTSASSESRWDKSASSWDTCASTSISRSSASTWETRASASASFRCPVDSIPGDATGQSRCNLAGSTSRSAHAMVISLLQPSHRC